MPWSVQVHRNIFIHGFPSVPPRAASHGCIRRPLTGRNPARWFYEGVTPGTPLQIGDAWPGEAGECTSSGSGIAAINSIKRSMIFRAASR